MNTKKTKTFSWKKFQESSVWKVFFLTFDTVFRVVTYPVFFIFVAIFQNHEASTKIGFYGPMYLVLACVLLFVTIVAISTMAWIYVVILDAVVAGVLVLTVSYPCWSEDYREKMGYRQWFD